MKISKIECGGNPSRGGAVKRKGRLSKPGGIDLEHPAFVSPRAASERKTSESGSGVLPCTSSEVTRNWALRTTSSASGQKLIKATRSSIGAACGTRVSGGGAWTEERPCE